MKMSLLVAGLFGAFLFVSISGAGHAQVVGVNATGPTRMSTLDWFEPLGVNIVDLVGQIPEEYLRGLIISYTPGYGIVQYMGGQRIGNTVVITTTVFPRFVRDGQWNGSMFGCLGQPAKNDQLGSVSPPSTIRILNGSEDVTRQATLYYYVPSGLHKPIYNPAYSQNHNVYRYYETPMQYSSFTPEGKLVMPGNMGCEIIISYRNYRELTVVFTLEIPQMIKVSVVGQQEFVFHSYLGAGYAGHLSALVGQLLGKGYPNRHEKFQMTIDQRADYLLINFPPMPADAYTAFPGNPTDNIDRPTGGTYRLVIGSGLSVDHVNGMGLPLYGHWQDMDQAGGEYLNYVKQQTGLAAPEYFLPPGVAYHSCMTYGGCSDTLLEQVYNASAVMRAIYLRIDRLSPALQRYAVQMVGPSWSPALMAAKPEPFRRSEIVYDHFTYLPLIRNEVPPLPPDDTAGCSLRGGCGWFTSDGRMVDYIPAP